MRVLHAHGILVRREEKIDHLVRRASRAGVVEGEEATDVRVANSVRIKGEEGSDEIKGHRGVSDEPVERETPVEVLIFCERPVGAEGG